eukprot:UN10438
MVSMLSILLGDVMACLKLDTILMIKKLLKDIKAPLKLHIATSNAAITDNRRPLTLANVDYKKLADWGLDTDNVGTLMELRATFSNVYDRLSIHLSTIDAVKAAADTILQPQVSPLLSLTAAQQIATAFQAIESAIYRQAGLFQPPVRNLTTAS